MAQPEALRHYQGGSATIGFVADPLPVRPLKMDEVAYEQAIRKEVLEPYYKSLESGLRQVESARETYDKIQAEYYNLIRNYDPEDPAIKQIIKLNRYHRKRVIETFRAALGVDISGVLKDQPVRLFMQKAILENVRLIKTIPKSLHDSLFVALHNEFRTAPFDRQKLMQILKERYDVVGYKARRIARDQTTKTIGKLTEIRQKGLGVEGYRWSTSLDERVRPTHVDNESRFFKWSDPPAITGHPGEDIQCRCVAIPVLAPSERDRLKEQGGYTPSSGGTPVPETPTDLGKTLPPVAPVPEPPPPEVPTAPPVVTPTSSYGFWDDPAWVATQKADDLESALVMQKTKKYHANAWHKDTPEEVMAAAKKRSPLDDIYQEYGKGSHYAHDNTLQMGYDDMAGLDSRRHYRVWRHEFGHAVDYDGVWPGRISTSEAFTKAMNKDRTRLRKLPPKSLNYTDQTSKSRQGIRDAWDERKALNRQAKQMADMGWEERAKLVDEAYDAVPDLTRQEVRKFLRDDTVSGVRLGLNEGQREALEWRFLKAWEKDDVQTLLDVMGSPRDNQLLGDVFGLNEWTVTAQDADKFRYLFYEHYKQGGIGHGLSDMLDAITTHRMKDGYAHTEGYYKGTRNAHRRGAETFANVVDLLGSGPFGEKVLRKVAPNALDAALDGIRAWLGN